MSPSSRKIFLGNDMFGHFSFFYTFYKTFCCDAEQQLHTHASIGAYKKCVLAEISPNQEVATKVRARAEGAPPEYWQASTRCGTGEQGVRTCPARKICRTVCLLSARKKITKFQYSIREPVR